MPSTPAALDPPLTEREHERGGGGATKKNDCGRERGLERENKRDGERDNEIDSAIARERERERERER